MLKTALKSKFIRIFFLVIVLIMVLGYLAAAMFGDAMRDYAKEALTKPMSDFADTSNTYMTYYVEHHSQKYTLKGNDEGWRVVDKKGNILYETKAPEATLANKENYLWQVSKDGITSIVNIKTGQAEWTGKAKESVYTDNAGYFVIEVSLDDKVHFAEKEYYLLGENYNVVLDGMTFEEILNEVWHGNVEDYIYGTLKDTKEACVVSSDGQVVYKKADAQVLHIVGDIAYVTFDGDTNVYNISLKGANQGQIVEVEWDE